MGTNYYKPFWRMTGPFKLVLLIFDDKWATHSRGLLGSFCQTTHSQAIMQEEEGNNLYISTYLLYNIARIAIT